MCITSCLKVISIINQKTAFGRQRVAEAILARKETADPRDGDIKNKQPIRIRSGPITKI